MIRFLQRDNQVTKILFGVIIGAACVSMVVYLVPGLMDNLGGGANTAGVYATVHAPGYWGRVESLFGASDDIKTQDVNRMAQIAIERQYQGKIPESQMGMMLQFMTPQVASQLVRETVEKQEADRLHLQVSDADLRNELHVGQFGQYLFPNGKYIGDDGYANFVQM